MKKNTSGFTLIELLVVIAIIGILAGITLAFLSNQNARANDKKIVEQLGSMRSQISLYTGALGSPVAPTTAPVVGVPGGNVFADNVLSDNGLYKLIEGLPARTDYYYAWDGTSPAITGKWFFAATLANGGTHCVDWAGASKVGASTISSPALTSSWSGVVNGATYTCL